MGLYITYRTSNNVVTMYASCYPTRSQENLITNKEAPDLSVPNMSPPKTKPLRKCLHYLAYHDHCNYTK